MTKNITTMTAEEALVDIALSLRGIDTSLRDIADTLEGDENTLDVATSLEAISQHIAEGITVYES